MTEFPNGESGLLALPSRRIPTGIERGFPHRYAARNAGGYRRLLCRPGHDALDTDRNAEPQRQAARQRSFRDTPGEKSGSHAWRAIGKAQR